MSEIQIFNNPEFGDVRTLTINGEPWFVGSDIAKALGYAKPQNAITTHCRHALKRGIGVRTGNKADGTPSIQNIEMLIIPEGDMYRLISKSKLKSAERFEEWVFDEVLPSIRKTGAYGAPQLPTGPMELLKIHYQALEQVDSKVNTLEQRFNNFEKSLPLLPNEADEVSNALKKRVVEVLGGKEAPVYKNCGKIGLVGSPFLFYLENVKRGLTFCVHHNIISVYSISEVMKI